MSVRGNVSDETPSARGFPRWAWWTLFLATLTFIIPATSPWWSKVLRGEIPDSAEEGEGGPTAAANAGAASEPPEVPGSTLKVILHTRLPGMPGLGRAEREIPYLRGVVPQIRAVVSELAVSSPELPALLPEGTSVLDVAYAPNGTAYVDFSPELEQGRGVGAEEERVLVQGIVTTITDNFSAVRRVVILVDGKAPKPGHLDLTRALRRDDPSFLVEEEPNSEGITPSPTGVPTPESPVSSPDRTPLPPAKPAASVSAR
ncbi:MAG: GerMN domain-containing protein [Vicinamibacteria bacterium]|nr:GerMN domain-containing protein [Vicinamibacteria bacterium]